MFDYNKKVENIATPLCLKAKNIKFFICVVCTILSTISWIQLFELDYGSIVLHLKQNATNLANLFFDMPR